MLCDNLRIKLERVVEHLEAGRTDLAREGLTYFRQAVAAQRGPWPGKHVSNTAYWLLAVNADVVLELLQSGANEL